MRLSPSQAATILTGQKTQHRLPKRPKRADIGVTFPIQTERTETDPATGERKRRWATAFHVRTTALYEQEMCEVSDKEAKAEGFKDRDEFFNHWQEKHGTRPISLAGPKPVPVYGITATVVCFEPTELPRFPAPVNRSDSEGRSYVHSPATAVDDQSVDAETQERISKGELRSVSQRQFDLQNQAERAKAEARSRASRLREIESRAINQGIDLSAHTERIEAELEEIQRKLEIHKAA